MESGSDARICNQALVTDRAMEAWYYPSIACDPQPEGHMASYIGRRKFLATLGGAATWPLAAGAQQQAMALISLITGTHQDDVSFAYGIDHIDMYRRAAAYADARCEPK
jgi:hypothetical protein